ncbi:GPI mannosyltransferase 3 [Vitis vinifera]|uniref:Mannosyltransferase n=1 Tax=Vitis vinifera TaxID=29760 RepID=A0A438HJX1_VITVI|nr:GPI mannosyltransferase 3 [Vitis vinifera]
MYFSIMDEKGFPRAMSLSMGELVTCSPQAKGSVTITLAFFELVPWIQSVMGIISFFLKLPMSSAWNSAFMLLQHILVLYFCILDCLYYCFTYNLTDGIRVLVLALMCLVDRLMYGSWILVPLNFLKFNFLSSGGDYYGTHKWHWYFTQGFPVMLFTFLPFSIAGMVLSKQWKPSGLIAWVLGLYSVLGHKEFRFVLPVLPMALMFSGYSIAAMKIADSSNSRRKGSSNSHVKCPSKVRLAIFFLLSTNIPMALYMSLFHQRGTEDVMNYLSKEASNNKVKSILFLMPCHATPYYSALHHDLPMRFLDCSPSEEKGTLDESDRFMMDPASFASEFAINWSLPSHIVMFDSEERSLREFLVSHSFKEIRRFFHAHLKVDRDLQASVVVYAFTGQ